DYHFNPDPVLYCKIPKDGEYELEIRDAVYRGRKDFVYRISVGPQPFITQAFPLGGREGVKTVAFLDGWNLTTKRLTLDTKPGDSSIRHASGRHGKLVSNSIPYAVDTLTECDESESNDTVKNAQRIDPGSPGKIINGRIAKPGDVDIFRIEGDAGDRIVAEVSARRLNSPLDSLLRLTDASGRVLAWNDDHVLKEKHLHIDRAGLLTHQADSYLLAELPKKGSYYVQLSDAQHHGSDAHAYRLRISAPQPDFELRATPSSLYTSPGGIVPICVYAIRRDGFDGDIEVKVKSPAGFELKGGRIPLGHNCMRMTLTAPKKPPDRPVALKLEGTAQVNGRAVTRPAEAADNVMQAYLYRHL
ncbi:MAG: peptidase, partial [Phycisphaerae bacterium]|nr:peptidase [Phycisphaerae bacterium]